MKVLKGQFQLWGSSSPTNQLAGSRNERGDGDGGLIRVLVQETQYRGSSIPVGKSIKLRLVHWENIRGIVCTNVWMTIQIQVGQGQGASSN